MPGKTQRRKRSHRKSHGKVGFRELNESISKAWQVVDDETRTFCRVLSEVEGKKYKKNDRAVKTNRTSENGKKKKSDKKIMSSSTKTNESGGECTKTSTVSTTNNDLFDILSSFTGLQSTISSFPQEVPQSLDKLSRKISNLSTTSSPSSSMMTDEFFVPKATNVLGSTTSLAASCTHIPSNSTSDDDCNRVSFTDRGIKQVDMDDDEILNMWRSINTTSTATTEEQVVLQPQEQKIQVHCQECIIPMLTSDKDLVAPAVETSSSSPATTSIVQVLEDEQKAGIMPAAVLQALVGNCSKDTNDDSILNLGRRSFIDTEYDLYRELGQTFRKKVIAARQA